MLDYKQCLEDASQGKPDWCPTELDEEGSVKCEMHKWGELKGLIAGTTSIVGLPGTGSKCISSVARSIDVSQNDLEDDKIQTSALFPPSSSSANGVCNNFLDGDTNAYLIHVGEGVDQDALDEFSDLFEMTAPKGCLFSNETAITHGTAFGETEFATMAQFGMKLIWSPASNLALYGLTTDIPKAISLGLTISLAPDWSMGGSQNLLDEVRAADTWDNTNWGDILKPIDLFNMVTQNAAKVLGLGGLLGRIEVGYLADIVVFTPTGGSAYTAVTESNPKSIRLVMIGGVPLYGDPILQELAPTSPGCELINLCDVSRFLCAAEANTADKLDQTSVDIQNALNAALLSADSLVPVDVSNCGGCAANEECYPYGAKPVVDASLCTPACTVGTACIQAKKSGSNQYQCLPEFTCNPEKSQKQFWPVAPLYACPPAGL
jgi:hypothetical protein